MKLTELGCDDKLTYQKWTKESESFKTEDDDLLSNGPTAIMDGMMAKAIGQVVSKNYS